MNYRLLATSCALLVTTLAARSELIFGLTVTNGLTSFDSASPATLVLPVTPITGLTSGDVLQDIDGSPVNGQLYGIATNGNLYSISKTTAAATLLFQASGVTGASKIDFNPTADRLRVIAGKPNANDPTPNNFRVTLDASSFDNAGLTAGAVTSDGAFAFATGDTLAGQVVRLVGSAYTNNTNGAASTTLFSLQNSTSGSTDYLVMHTGTPSFSTLMTVASLTIFGQAIDIGDFTGFDISQSGIAYVTLGNGTNQTAISTLNLTNGQLSNTTQLASNLALRAIATNAVPEPTTALLLGLAALALGARRQRASALSI